MTIAIAVLLVVAFVAVFVILPIKLAATWVGAERTGWFICLFAGIIAGIISAIANQIVHFGAIGSIFVVGAVYMLVLGTTYVRGLIIAVLELVLTYAFVAVIVATALAPKLLGLFGVHFGGS
jgi:hypothetical protein